MKIKISILLLVLISLINMGAVCNYKENNQDFFNAEIYMENKSQFIENGVKLQYKVDDNIDSEIAYIKNHLIKNMKTNYSNLDKNKLYIKNDDFNVQVNMWSESNYTHVEIILLNSNSNFSCSELVEFLKKLERKNFEDEQYYLYYKGKINGFNNENKEKLLENLGIKNINLLKINNGYTGVGNFNNGKKVNFALADYRTGYYVIIGTPIIFMAY